MAWQCFVFTAALTGLAATATADDVRVSSRDELVRAVSQASAGRVIRMAPGDYAGGLVFDNLAGTAENPIVIAGADRERPPVITGGRGGLKLTRPMHVELRDLVITASETNGLNIDDGGQLDSPARGLVLRRVVVRDTGGDANHDGIKLSGLADFQLLDCTVERWGRRGSAIDMVGCRNGELSGCTIRNAAGELANGVQMKGGSRDVVVRNCRFIDAGSRAVNIGGSTGLEYFRPRPDGFEAKDILIEECEFDGSQSPLAFVGVDGAVVRGCTIRRPRGWVMRILQETKLPEFVRCRNGQFLNNTVEFRSDEVRTTVNVGPDTAPETFRFAGNTWRCLDRPQATKELVRLPTTEVDAVYGTAN